MKIDVWSDVVCPWCYIGKRRLESAMAEFEHAEEVTITWRSFELNPASPKTVDGPLVEVLAKKYGMPMGQAEQMMQRVVDTAAEEGVTMRFDIAQSGNTLDAHRVLHHARQEGLGGQMKERLLAAYFTEGKPISDRDALAALAGEVGLDAAKVRELLDSDEYVDAVRAEEAQAHAYGAGGVPFFVIDDKYGVSGAQPSDTLLRVLRTAHTEQQPAVDAGEACVDDECAI